MLKRGIVNVLTCLGVAGAFICLSMNVRKNESYAKEVSESLKEDRIFSEFEIIDEITDFEKNTYEEIMSGPGQVNILTENDYLPIENDIYENELLHETRLNNIRFGDISCCQRGFGYPVYYQTHMSEREKKMIRQWEERTVDGEECPECNDGIETAIKWIKEGNLQEPLEEFLKNYPEINPKEREYALHITRAEETYREEDETSWWEVGFCLKTKTDNGERVNLIFGEVRRTTMYQGEEVWYEDADYSFSIQSGELWRLLEKPEEDFGENWIDFFEEDFGENGFSEFYSISDEDREEWVLKLLEKCGTELVLPKGADEKISWECHREEDFWYDYIVCSGETCEYEVKIAIPLMPADSGDWYMASRIRKEAQDKSMCNDTFSIMRQTFHAVPYEYVVKEGDTLFKIAENYLKDGDEYVRLGNANMIRNQDLIYPGEIITITP
ncbi:MAG: LysM peptidoglycan-binding domain-containing protein [Lachnospiraceae bacterium]|nr:LysM peptidoglycan-binding domain-containing protein [Lachnospiraceae bacterium]